MLSWYSPGFLPCFALVFTWISFNDAASSHRATQRDMSPFLLLLLKISGAMWQNKIIRLPGAETQSAPAFFVWRKYSRYSLGEGYKSKHTHTQKSPGIQMLSTSARAWRRVARTSALLWRHRSRLISSKWYASQLKKKKKQLRTDIYCETCRGKTRPGDC